MIDTEPMAASAPRNEPADAEPSPPHWPTAQHQTPRGPAQTAAPQCSCRGTAKTTDPSAPVHRHRAPPARTLRHRQAAACMRQAAGTARHTVRRECWAGPSRLATAARRSWPVTAYDSELAAAPAQRQLPHGRVNEPAIAVHAAGTCRAHIAELEQAIGSGSSRPDERISFGENSIGHGPRG